MSRYMIAAFLCLKLTDMFLPMDSRVQDRIRSLVSSGIVSLPEVQRHLAHYVENDLFHGETCPARSDSSFWPTNKAVLNAVYRASRLVSCNLYTKS